MIYVVFEELVAAHCWPLHRSLEVPPTLSFAEPKLGMTTTNIYVAAVGGIVSVGLRSTAYVVTYAFCAHPLFYH